MAENYQKTSGTLPGYTTDRGKATLITEPVIGVVKNNVDATRSGRIEVYIATFGGTDPDNRDNWTPVDYLSPFMGVVAPGGDPEEGPDRDGWGKFVGNPQSYGFWASAPDIGTQVVCLFVNGLKDQGYYIGCIPRIGMLQMTPAIGGSSLVVPNEGESTAYGGADRLPVSEVNFSNPAVQDSGKIYSEPKPVHSYQASILAQQGLIRDPIRGVVGSSAQRESPSRVFGWSTPGGPIYEGGYTSATVAQAVANGETRKLQIVGRTGGHTFVMDDGALDGSDQLVRLRTAAGHQILMSDSGQTLFIMHSNGQSWVELGREGTVDVFSTNSVNIRTQGDLNLHADRDINLNAGGALKMRAKSIAAESEGDTDWRSGGAWRGSSTGNWTVKTAGSAATSAAGEASMTAGGTAWVNGSKVNLNSGSASTEVPEVAPMAKTNHIDTVWSEKVGWMNPAPQPLTSIVSRAPAHQPWVGSGTGVDVKVSPQSPAASGQTTPAVDTLNATSPPAPAVPVDIAEAAAVPPVSVSVPTLTDSGVAAMTAQMAVNAQSLPAELQRSAGVVSTISGVTANQLETAGAIKPGSGALTTELISRGMEPARALAGSMTGAAGAESPQALLSNGRNQAGVVQGLMSSSAQQLRSRGILTGTEGGGQSGGVIMAATTMGVNAVSGLIGASGLTAGVGSSGIVGGGKIAAGGITSDLAGALGAGGQIAGVVGNLASNLSAGKLAGGLGSGLGSQSGIQSAVSGLAAGLGLNLGAGGLGAPSSGGLESALQTAFGAVEASYGRLKPGQPNALGPRSSGASQPSSLTQASDALKSADSQVASAEEALLEAKRDYRIEPSAENQEAVVAAESALAAAKQRQTQASNQFLGAMPGAAVSALGMAAAASSTGRGTRGNTSRRGGNLGGAFGGLGKYIKIGNLGIFRGRGFPVSIPGMPNVRIPGIPRIPGFPGGAPGVPRLPGFPRGIPSRRPPLPPTRRRPGRWEERPPGDQPTIPDNTGLPAPTPGDYPQNIPSQSYPNDGFGSEDGTSTWDAQIEGQFNVAENQDEGNMEAGVDNGWETYDGEVPNSLNTGMAALPGGTAAFFPNLDASGTAANPLAGVLDTATDVFPSLETDLLGGSPTGGDDAIVDQFPGLDGDLMGGTFGSIENAVEEGDMTGAWDPPQDGTGVNTIPTQDGNGPPGSVYRRRGSRRGPPIRRPVRIPGIPRVPGLPDIGDIPGLGRIGRGRLGNLSVILGRQGKFNRPGARRGGKKTQTSALSAAIISQLQATLSVILSQSGRSRAPVSATNTFDFAPLIAKTGQLLGDPKIPQPIFGGSGASTNPASLPPPNPQIEQQQQEQVAALDAVREAEARVSNALANLRVTQAAFGRTTNNDSVEQIQAAREALQEEEDRLAAARESYAVVIARGAK